MIWVHSRIFKAATALMIMGGFLAGCWPGSSGPPKMQPGTPILDRPWTQDAQKFSFVIVGDKTGGGLENWPILDRAITEINLLRPDFAIMLGDLIQGYTSDTARIAAQWDEFWEHLDPIEAPFLFLPGNHDVSNPTMLKWWKEKYGRTYYNFVYRDCHFMFLNTDERRDGGDGYFDTEQVEWALSAVKSNRKRRHTFVFMHKPAWRQGHVAQEWQRIEEALNGIPYTVLSGHKHRLIHDRNDDGHQYIVLGPTGGGLAESPVKKYGAFHHYTKVTVDGDSVYFAVIEPGNIWPVEIATADFRNAVEQMITSSVAMPVPARYEELSTELMISVGNSLPDTVRISIRFDNLKRDGWWPTSTITEPADSFSFFVPPADTVQRSVHFVTLERTLHDVPTFVRSIWYRGSKLLERKSPLPIYPDSVWRHPAVWDILGPFAVGEIRGGLSKSDPRGAVPGAYLYRGIDKGWSAEAIYFDGDTTTRTWRRIESRPEGWVDFGRVDNAIIYATCRIFSPSARSVILRLREDDFARVMLNREWVGGDRLIRTQRNPAYVSLGLNSGWNSLTVAVVNNRGGWSMRFLVADPDNSLRFAAHSDTSSKGQ